MVDTTATTHITLLLISDCSLFPHIVHILKEATIELPESLTPDFYMTCIVAPFRSFRSLFIKPSEGFPSPPTNLLYSFPCTYHHLKLYHMCGIFYFNFVLFCLLTLYCLFACLLQSMLTPQENNDLILLISLESDTNVTFCV